ncbi:DUF2157 domain-containing protein [Gloeothece verrucosa]|uniref:DUF2157 domain-containing protein n=1 Tax=Gloeothece verrucosa (strain PCC 7822) TaxID=497965 RepID=E0UE48_GLOV7|nr:DUF2157 domain-containing protein [Gloeothece verrucosa]ADN14173.1 Protein of unknown function DUF2157, membrane [Gloeothece verrucosa PCC 7822]
MVSEKFRHQLQKEAKEWFIEGLIDEEAYTRIAARYRFSELETSARNRFIMILIGLGSILLGLAVITFVAANWQVWSREIKVVLLVSLLIAVEVSGFYLWRISSERWQSRLGKGFLLLGGLIFGANLGLMSQMFHQSGSTYQLFLVWGLGVLVMAYSLRLSQMGILAIILVGLGYLSGLFRSSIWEGSSILELAITQMPLLTSLLFIPLAYWCRSRFLFGLAVILIVVSFSWNLGSLLWEFFTFNRLLGGVLTAVASCLPPALLWGYRDSLWGFSAANALFNPIGRFFGLLFLAILFYWFSFNIWYDKPFNYLSETGLNWQQWLYLLDVIGLGGLTIWAWWQLAYSGEGNEGSQWTLESNSLAVAAIIVLTGLMIFCQITIQPLGAIGTIIFNILLFLLAAGLIREALRTGQRKGFWGGVILFALQLLSRMIEYNTGLLLKAIVLFFCGLAVIAAGLWFERYLRSLNSISEGIGEGEMTND